MMSQQPQNICLFLSIITSKQAYHFQKISNDPQKSKRPTFDRCFFVQHNISVNLTTNTWTTLFTAVLARHAPSGIEIHGDLSIKKGETLALKQANVIANDTKLLKGLWEHLPMASIIQFRAPTYQENPGDWIHLLQSTSEYHSPRFGEFHSCEDLAMVIVVPQISPILIHEAQYMHWDIQPISDGYYSVLGTPYRTYIVATNEVSISENDPLLSIFATKNIPGLSKDEATFIASIAVSNIRLQQNAP